MIDQSRRGSKSYGSNSVLKADIIDYTPHPLNGKLIDIYLDVFFFLLDLDFAFGTTGLALLVLRARLLPEDPVALPPPVSSSSSSPSSSSSSPFFSTFFFDLVLALRFRGSGFEDSGLALALPAGLMVLQHCNVLEEEWDGARITQSKSLPGQSGC